VLSLNSALQLTDIQLVIGFSDSSDSKNRKNFSYVNNSGENLFHPLITFTTHPPQIQLFLINKAVLFNISTKQKTALDVPQKLFTFIDKKS